MLSRVVARIGRQVTARSRSFKPLQVATLSSDSAQSATDQTDSDWTTKWTDATSSLRSDVSFDESAARLRELIQTDLLRFTDLQHNPARFFEAHRILARHAVQHGPGFWIRFTVQYNLFAGTILAVGGDDQVRSLDDMQSDAQLGCFGLTEKLAGVQSGLVVNTTINWDNEKQKFILNTPNEGARKNWISQGAVCDKAVVLADLSVEGKRCGPHAFVMDFRQEGSVVDGIHLEDMGRKTTGNDLDNAWIHFNNVELPKDAMLNRYADVVDGKYVQKVKGVRPFDMIGQRLYTGRIAVAQAALSYCHQLFDVTKNYSDNKQCYSMSGDVYLSNIPQLNALYIEADEKLSELNAFVDRCETELSECLVSSTLPSAQLVEAIATCKVMAVEHSIRLCHLLKQEVGSFALMEDSGFKHLDFLQCCKFAEGDSRILMQKMARDALKEFTVAGGVSDGSDESELCAQITSSMAAEIAVSGDKQKAWDANWRNIYALAEVRMENTLGQIMA